MSIKLWIDDFRSPPDTTWTWARTLEEAMYYVTGPVEIAEISFDHDLGVKDLINMKWVDTQPVAKWYEEQAENGNLIFMPIWFVHSANPSGRRELIAILQRAERFIADRKMPDGVMDDGRIIVETK